MNKIGYRMMVPLLLGLAAWLSHGPVYAQPLAATGKVGTLKVERHGNHGQPVILIPGLEGGPWVWERTIRALQKDHVVYAVTLAGFDGVPPPAGGGNLFDQADASLKQLIERRKIDKPVLVGHSLGGTLALRFAGEHPQMISGVVAVDGLPVFPGMERMGVDQRKAMAAGLAQLRELDRVNGWAKLEELGAEFEAGTRAALKKAGRNYVFQRIGSMFCLYFTEGEVWNLADAMRSDKAGFARYFHACLEAGVYFAPSQFEAGFISLAHSHADLEKTAEIAARELTA